MPSRKTTLLSQKNLCYHAYPFPEEATDVLCKKMFLKLKVPKRPVILFKRDSNAGVFQQNL